VGDLTAWWGAACDHHPLASVVARFIRAIQGGGLGEQGWITRMNRVMTVSIE
jgi:hypothetical protein